MPRTDTERLDWLEKQGQAMPWIARESERHGGYRIHNTTRAESSPTIREAIDTAMDSAEQWETTNTMLRVEGETQSLKCKCRCNVFRKQVGRDRYKCNACGATFTGLKRIDVSCLDDGSAQ